jgi:DNA-directed RNA polymerase specialized sigma24 family protein
VSESEPGSDVSPEPRSVFEALARHERAVLVLGAVLHWEPGEVAELLDVRVDAVLQTLRRARVDLGTDVGCVIDLASRGCHHTSSGPDVA